jgi:hypothetical protein
LWFQVLLVFAHRQGSLKEANGLLDDIDLVFVLRLRHSNDGLLDLRIQPHRQSGCPSPPAAPVKRSAKSTLLLFLARLI